MNDFICGMVKLRKPNQIQRFDFNMPEYQSGLYIVVSVVYYMKAFFDFICWFYLKVCSLCLATQVICE